MIDYSGRMSVFSTVIDRELLRSSSADKKCMLISLYSLQFKYIKMHQQKILFIGRNVLAMHCFLSSDHRKKFQVSSAYDVNVESQIWSVCYNLCL